MSLFNAAMDSSPGRTQAKRHGGLIASEIELVKTEARRISALNKDSVIPKSILPSTGVSFKKPGTKTAKYPRRRGKKTWYLFATADWGAVFRLFAKLKR